MPEDHVNIRPGVSILSVLRHLNYKPWYALAEFVDNSLQSFIGARDALLEADGTNRAKVTIELDTDGRRITIRDNAAGIDASAYARAFRPAEVPPDRSGLAEFGMGLKSASCWFAPRWTVRTTALDEPIQRTVTFDIERIVRDEIEELSVATATAPHDEHFTEIELNELYHPPRGPTIAKIKDHLSSIYRIFIRQGLLELRFGTEALHFDSPDVLVAPPFREPETEPVSWRKDIELDFGGEHRVHGFAALREVGSTSEAGFALFRRNRLIQGSRDEAYRPQQIFGASNSFSYQRLFGELHLDGFEVSHTKDGFQWEEHEGLVLEELKRQLDDHPVPLLSQAEGYRSRVRTEEVSSGAQAAVDHTAEVVAERAGPVIEEQLDAPPEPAPTPTHLPAAAVASHRNVAVNTGREQWLVELELSTDPAIGDWVSLSEVTPASGNPDQPRRIAVRVSLVHPFMERFVSPEASQIEPLLRVAVALAIAEVTARESGVSSAGAIRRRVNQLLREALSHP